LVSQAHAPDLTNHVTTNRTSSFRPHRTENKHSSKSVQKMFFKNKTTILLSGTVVVAATTTLGALSFINHAQQFKTETEATFAHRNELLKKFAALHRDQVTVMAQLVQKRFTAPDPADTNAATAIRTHGHQGWEVLPGISQAQGSFTGSAPLPLDAQVQREMRAALAMDVQIQTTRAFDTDVVWSYYLSAGSFLYLAPRIGFEEFHFSPALYQKRYWLEAAPQANPTRRMILAGPYQDGAGKGHVLTFASPVYAGDQFLGIVAEDVTTSTLDTLLKFGDAIGQSLLISENDRVISGDAYVKQGAHIHPPLSDKLIDWREDASGDLWLSSQIVKDELWLVHRVPLSEVYWAAAKETAGVWVSLLMFLLMFWMASARARMAQHLRKSEAMYRMITDNTDDVIWMVNLKDQRFAYVSPSVERLHGWKAEDLVGQPWQTMFDADASAALEGRLAANLQGVRDGDHDAAHATLALALPHKDGTRIPIEIAASILLDDDGQPRQILGVTRDMREHAKVDQLKSEFISTVSHELRTPLTSIRGALGLIAGGAVGELPAAVKPLIDIAHKNSERLIFLVNDILDMEKMAAGKMVFDLKPVELTPLLVQALESNRAYAEQFKVRYVLAADGAGIKLKVDTNRFLQVLANLLSNAAKFATTDTDVTISAERVQGRVRIAVKNTGPGIKPEFRERVFQKFSQGDSADNRSKGGTGLGLAITKTMVEKMGGTIGFDSEPDVATVFYCDFDEYLD